MTGEESTTMTIGTENSNTVSEKEPQLNTESISSNYNPTKKVNEAQHQDVKTNTSKQIVE